MPLLFFSGSETLQLFSKVQFKLKLLHLLAFLRRALNVLRPDVLLSFNLSLTN